jgi:hypothetical protein
VARRAPGDDLLLPGHGVLPTLAAGGAALLGSSSRLPAPAADAAVGAGALGELPLLGLTSLGVGLGLSWAVRPLVRRTPPDRLVSLAAAAGVLSGLTAVLAGGTIAGGLVAAALAVLASRATSRAVSASGRAPRAWRFVPAGSAVLGIVVFAISAALTAETRAETPRTGLARLAEIVVDALEPRTAPPPRDDAPTPPPERRVRRLVVVTVDALAWDALSCHGGAQPTPTLDRLAATGLDFERALTPSTVPGVALAALATGREADGLADLASARTMFDEVHLVAGRSALMSSGPSALEGGPPLDRALGAGRAWAVRDRRELPARIAELPTPLDLVWVHLGDTLDAPRIDAELASLMETLITRDADLVFTALRAEGSAIEPAELREAQIRVPLIVVSDGVAAGRPRELVSSTTVLRAVAQRARGATGPALDLPPSGDVYVSSRRAVLLARGAQRLSCERGGACVSFDLASDPLGRRPSVLVEATGQLTAALAERRVALVQREGADPVEIAFLRLELGAEGAGSEIERLLEGRDVAAQRRVARRLFDLQDRRFLPALRAALPRVTDPTVKALVALALTRLGDGATLAIDLLDESDDMLADLAALALLENGVDRGFDRLVRRLRAALVEEGTLDLAVFSADLASAVARALGKTRREEVVGLLVDALEVPALTQAAARALASAGHDAGRPALARALTRVDRASVAAVAESLLALGGGPELAQPLTELLGRAVPPSHALQWALAAKVARFAGGPTRDAEAARLRRFATSGVLVDFVVPEPSKGSLPKRPRSVRLTCLASAPEGGQIRVGARADTPLSSEKKAAIPTTQPVLDETRSVVLEIPAQERPIEIGTSVPSSVAGEHGVQISLVVYATQGVTVSTCALVPTVEDPPTWR